LPSLHIFLLHLKCMETKTIMEHFETKNLIFLHIVCLTLLKSNVIFLHLFEIFIFFLIFYVDLRFVTLFFCVYFMILLSLVACFWNLNSKGWVCYYFYIFIFWIFLFLTESNRPIICKNRSPFYGRIGLYFLTLRFHLDYNFGPERTQCPTLEKVCL
jgi:hypothetical protein